MSLWDRLKSAFSPPTMEHPLFGQITFMAIKAPRHPYWEVRSTTFRSTGTQVQLFIDGDETGPSASALVNWETIQDRYASLWPSLEEILVRAYADWIPNAGPQSGKGRFALESVGVLHDIMGPEEWDFGYGCADDNDHSFTVRMKGWEPNPEARIDG